jgi:carbamoyltransferase
MRKILILNPNSSFALDPAYFSIHGKGRMMLWDNGEPALEDVFAGKITETFGPPRKKDEELSAYHRDIAASLQKRYEEAFFHVLNYAYKATGLANLCLAGGCALNSLANGKIFDQTPFRSVYIQPGASDAGGALGAAFYLQNQILKAPRAFTMEHAYWGPAFSEEEIEAVLNSRRGELGGCAVSRAGDEDELCRKTALLISDGKIVGWFQGRMEWGQRALGNRSILADPRRSEMKDVLNARIKRREHFRPFAPSILEERTAEYFEEGYPDPFMQKVYPIRKEKRDRIPAVVHVDGTGRLQTVARSQNPLYWKLIREFESLTGIPVLLNTSFNENEPIVCAPSEALDCFVRTRMDALVIGRLMIERK